MAPRRPLSADTRFGEMGKGRAGPADGLRRPPHIGASHSPRSDAGAFRSEAGPHAFDVVLPRGAADPGIGEAEELGALTADGRQKALRRSTTSLVELCRSLDPQRDYAVPPRRILTSDARPTTHGSWDNALSHAIVAVGDAVRTGPDEDACVYQVTDTLGAGTFASVYSCTWLDVHGTQDNEGRAGGAQRHGALKIVRNSPAYALQALQELRILRLLNDQHDPHDTHHIVRLQRAFTYRHHICFVFEPLGCSLLDLLAGSGYRGLPLQQVRPLLADLLDAMEVLDAADVVHADVKPENVLLLPDSSAADIDGLRLKLIDFGSAVLTNEIPPTAKPSHYHQSRFYRAPEVLVGAAQYSMQPGIDLWSCGCIAAELYLGLPIFPGTNEYEQLLRIQEIVGNPPDDVLRASRRTNTFFDSIVVRSTKRQTFRLKPPEAFGSREADVERFFEERDLFSLISNHSEVVPSDMSSVDAQLREAAAAPSSDCEDDNDDHTGDGGVQDEASREDGCSDSAMVKQKELEALWVKAFAHFLCGLVDADPRRRWTAREVSSHPFITGVDLARVMIWRPDLATITSSSSKSDVAASAAIAIEGGGGGGGSGQRGGDRLLAKSTSPRREPVLDGSLALGGTRIHTLGKERRIGSDSLLATPPKNGAGAVASGHDRGMVVTSISSSAPAQTHIPPGATATTPSAASPWFGGGGLEVASGLSPQQPTTPVMGGATCMSTMATAAAAANMTNSAADAMRSVAALEKAESRRWKQQPVPRLAAGAAHKALKMQPTHSVGSGGGGGSGSAGTTLGFEPGFRELLRRIDTRRRQSTAS